MAQHIVPFMQLLDGVCQMPFPPMLYLGHLSAGVSHPLANLAYHLLPLFLLHIGTDDVDQLVFDIQDSKNELQIQLSSELYGALQRVFSGADLVPVSAINMENLDLLFTQISNVLTGGDGFEVFR